MFKTRDSADSDVVNVPVRSVRIKMQHQSVLVVCQELARVECCYAKPRTSSTLALKWHFTVVAPAGMEYTGVSKNTQTSDCFLEQAAIEANSFRVTSAMLMSGHWENILAGEFQRMAETVQSVVTVAVHVVFGD